MSVRVRHNGLRVLLGQDLAYFVDQPFLIRKTVRPPAAACMRRGYRQRYFQPLWYLLGEKRKKLFRRRRRHA